MECGFVMWHGTESLNSELPKVLSKVSEEVTKIESSLKEVEESRSKVDSAPESIEGEKSFADAVKLTGKLCQKPIVNMLVNGLIKCLVNLFRLLGIDKK